MAIKTTTWQNTDTEANYDGIKIQLRFKYEAVRTGPNLDQVKFKIEPQVYFADKGENTTSNALAVFFNQKKYDSKGSTTFTHSCNCNKTGSSWHDGARRYKWYGSSGSYTSAGENAYPNTTTNTDVYGNWENIVVSAGSTQTSIDLYFYWYAKWGRGNWKEKGDIIWNDAQNYPVSASFTIPQGYEQLTGFTTVTIQTDYSMQGSTSPIASNTALESINVSWARVADKLNNRVKKYTVQVRTYGQPNMLINPYGSIEVPVNDASTGYSLSITRQQMENIVKEDGQEPRKANLNYITGQTSNTWSTFDIRVTATGEHGSVASGWSSARYQWNELPGPPLDGEINIEGVGKDYFTGETYWIDMHHWGKYSVQPKRILDNYLPRTNALIGSGEAQLEYRAVFQWEEDYPTPGALEYPSDLLPAVSTAQESEGRPVSITDGAAGINIEADGKGHFYYDSPIFYGHFIGYDGLSYSNEATTWKFHLGKQLGFEPGTNWTIEGGGEMGEYATITPTCNLVIPPLMLDESAYLTPSSGAVERYTIYYSVDGLEYQYLNSLAVSTSRENKVFNLADSKLWEELTDKIPLVGTEAQTVHLKIDVVLYMSGYAISFETEPQTFAIQGLSAKCGFLWADDKSVFLYSLGQRYPVVRDKMTGQLEVTGPLGTSLKWYLDYVPFEKGGAATGQEWSTAEIAAQGNIELNTVTSSMPSGLGKGTVQYSVSLPSTGTEEYKYRYRILDERHKDRVMLLPVGWGFRAYETAGMLEPDYYVVKRYQVPQGISLLSPTIADDRYAYGRVKWQSSFKHDTGLNAGDKLFAIKPYAIGLDHINIQFQEAEPQLYYAGYTSQPIGECNFTIELNFGSLVQDGENYVFPFTYGVLSMSDEQGIPRKHYLPIPSENGLPRNQNATFALNFVCYECLSPIPGWSINDSNFNSANLALSSVNVLLVSDIQVNGFATLENVQPLSEHIRRRGAGVIA